MGGSGLDGPGAEWKAIGPQQRAVHPLGVASEVAPGAAAGEARRWGDGNGAGEGLGDEQPPELFRARRRRVLADTPPQTNSPSANAQRPSSSRASFAPAASAVIFWLHM